MISIGAIKHGAGDVWCRDEDIAAAYVHDVVTEAPGKNFSLLELLLLDVFRADHAPATLGLISRSAASIRGDCDAPAIVAAAVYAGHRCARELDSPVDIDMQLKHDRIDVGLMPVLQ